MSQTPDTSAMRPLSQSAERFTQQAVHLIIQRINQMQNNGHDVIRFEVGSPAFPMPNYISQSLCDGVMAGNTDYVASPGVNEFRHAIAEHIQKTRGFKPSLDQILITPGANSILYLVMRCVANKGDEIIIPDPGYAVYMDAINGSGTTPVYVPVYEHNDFCMRPQDVEAAITNKTKLIILNSPSNPTGAVMDKETLIAIAEIGKKHGIYVLTDEVYDHIVYDGDFYSVSSLDHCLHNTILLNGLSKSYCMSGSRVGYVVSPPALNTKLTALVSTIVSCVPPYIQQAGLTALTGDQSVVAEMKQGYYDRVKTLVDGLNSIDGITCLMPKGAFYAFANIKGTGMTSQDFFEYCLQNAHVSCMPGTLFGPNGEGYVRMSASPSIPRIKQAIKRLKSTLENRKT